MVRESVSLKSLKWSLLTLYTVKSHFPKSQHPRVQGIVLGNGTASPAALSIHCLQKDTVSSLIKMGISRTTQGLGFWAGSVSLIYCWDWAASQRKTFEIFFCLLFIWARWGEGRRSGGRGPGNCAQSQSQHRENQAKFVRVTFTVLFFMIKVAKVC